MSVYEGSVRRERREDIQGVRVIGALLVFSFHVFFTGVSGGVDVFFVISGYFLASNAVKRNEIAAPASLVAFYRDFLLRVAPQAAVALIGILFLLLLFTSPMVWQVNLRDIVASAVYMENLRLISRGQDYLARSEALTLVQHFWAVALIGQTYFAWPFVLRLARFGARRLGAEPRQALMTLVALLSLVSLSWSLYFTNVAPTTAYFDFFSRFWEFGSGVLLGLHAIPSAIGRTRQALLSWLGLGLLIGCGFLIGSTQAFPGYAALWPVSAALLLIHYGRPQDRWNASWLLSRPWLAGFGAISFSVYLWHWPLFVVYDSASGDDQVSLLAGLALLLATLACALLSKQIVDWFFSLRRVSSHRMLVATGFLSLLVAIASTSEFARREIVAKGETWDARDLRKANFIAPGPFSVRDDNAPVYESGCHQNGVASKVKSCSFGKSDADKTIVVVGGSHSVQWLPALLLHAEKEGWKIVSMTKSGCLFADPVDQELFATMHPSCASWNKDAIEQIVALAPDLVITLATRQTDVDDERIEFVPAGYTARFDQLGAHGIRVLALRDNPWMTKDVPVCVYSPIVDNKNQCGDERDEVLDDLTYGEARRKIPQHVHVADMSAHFCDAEQCWAVKDNVVIYRDSNHITATYAERISPALRDIVRSAAAGLPLPRQKAGVAGG